MKKSNELIRFEIDIGEGQNIKVLLRIKDLKTHLNESKDMTISLNTTDGKNVKIKFSLPEIRQLVSKYNLTVYNIVPKTLSKYITDYTMEIAQKVYVPIIGREEEISKAWFYLSQNTKNNVFLVGDVDVGKSAIAQELIRQVTICKCPEKFYGCRVLYLNIEELLAIKSDHKYERIIKTIKEFLKNSKEYVMLYVDDSIYMKMDEDLIMLLHSIIAKYNIPIIICSRIKEYESLYEEDYFIKKHENIIFVEEPEYKDVVPIIEYNIPYIEKQYGIKVSEKMAKFIVYTSPMLDAFSCNPGRSIDILEKSAMYAKLNGKTELDKECVLNCYYSRIKLFNAMSEEAKRITAYHEVGHYIVLRKSKISEAAKTLCVSILPTMDYIGVNFKYYMEEKCVDWNYDFMIESIAANLAGRVAEKEITKTISTGASADLDNANTTAESMLMKYGFSEVENQNRSFMLGGYYIKDYLLTDSNKEIINKEIKSIIDKAYKRAEEIIQKNRGLLDIIAENLLKEYVLTEEDLEEIIKKYEESK